MQMYCRSDDETEERKGGRGDRNQNGEVGRDAWPHMSDIPVNAMGDPMATIAPTATPRDMVAKVFMTAV